MNTLSVEEILELHREAIRKWGGDGTLKGDTIANIGSVLYSAQYNDGLLGYAAGLLCYFARAQHFMDGSKRVGWGSCVRALEVNGYTLDVEVESAIAFVTAVVLENSPVSDIADRLATWLCILE